MPNVVMPFAMLVMRFQDTLGPLGRLYGTPLAVEHEGRISRWRRS